MLAGPEEREGLYVSMYARMGAWREERRKLLRTVERASFLQGKPRPRERLKLVGTVVPPKVDDCKYINMFRRIL